MKLKSFKYISENKTGWNSELIKFADEITILMGDNGTGKTPMLWGMAFALGYPLALAPDITANADKVEMILIKDNRDIIFTRKLNTPFEILVLDEEVEKRYTSERDFSDYFFTLVNFNITKLSSTRSSQAGTRPYVSNFLPLIWISQSMGWTYTYQPLHNQNFIKDQHEEMMRLLLNIPPKHPYERKKSYEEKKSELALIEERLEFSRKSLESYKKELGAIADLNPKFFEDEKYAVKDLLEGARNKLSSITSDTRDIDLAISEIKSGLFHVQLEKRKVESKISSLEKAYDELDGETEVLESNEVATDEFKKFCGSFDCKMFETSKRLYGKRLLYLKDQLKDIKFTTSTLKDELSSVDVQLGSKQKMLLDLEKNKTELTKTNGTSEILRQIESLGKSFSVIDENQRKYNALIQMQNSYVTLLNKKTSLEAEVKDLKPTSKRDNTRLHDVLEVFRESFRKWLNILQTPNVKSSSIDESFNAILNEVRFSQSSFQDGSTRSRIVLAYIASLLETAVKVKGNHPGFLFLDTPRQHELHLPHLQNYFNELRKLMRSSSIQVIIACKDSIFEPGRKDNIYLPSYNFGGEIRYLGPEALKVQDIFS